MVPSIFTVIEEDCVILVGLYVMLFPVILNPGFTNTSVLKGGLPMARGDDPVVEELRPEPVKVYPTPKAVPCILLSIVVIVPVIC